MNNFLNKIFKRRIDVVLLIFISLFLIFWNLSSISLWSPDEPRFAVIVRNMVEHDDYIIPEFNGFPLYWKPILVYWLQALPAKIIGNVTPLTSRLPSAFAGFGILMLFYFFIKHFRNKKEAFLSTAILITNYTFLEQARLAIIDMTLTFCMFVALIAFFNGYMRIDKREKFYLVLYAFLGLAVISKGPVGIIVPLMIIFFFLMVEKNLKHLKDLFLLKGILIFLVITLPWYIAALMQGGSEFFNEFIIKQNITRFFNAFDHIQPFYYYIERILTHFFPWSLLLIPALIMFVRDHKYKKANNDKERSFFSFILIWTVSVFLFFTISKSKRSQYILLMYPAMSFVIAYLWSRISNMQESEKLPFSALWLKTPISLMCLIMGIFFIAFPSFVKYAGHFSSSYFVKSLIWCVFLVLIIFYIGEALTKKSAVLMLTLLIPRIFVFSFMMYAFMVVSLYPQLDIKRSAIPYANRINRTVKNEEFITFYIKRPEFVFYLNRGPLTVLDESETDKLIKYLNKDKKVYCLIRRRYYNDRLKYLKNVRHFIVLNDLKGWKWDFLLISN